MSSLEPLPFERRGIPARFGSPRPGSGCGAGYTDSAPASSWAGWTQCCLLWFTLGFLAMGRVCSPAQWEQGRLRCCWTYAAAAQEPLLLFCYRIRRNWWEIRGSALTPPGPRDTLSSGAQPTTPRRDTGSGAFGRVDGVGKEGWW